MDRRLRPPTDGTEDLPLVEFIFAADQPRLVLKDLNQTRARAGLEPVPPSPSDGPMATVFFDPQLSQDQKRWRLTELANTPGDNEPEFRVIASLLR